ncbi:MAG: tripartite tricarboxylate transporter substrate binding protein [Betaproteobacteria bacterium]|nr:tripartite tricarboxylate transporter substrate binding protein [Betaproteobacteria bacterium]
MAVLNLTSVNRRRLLAAAAAGATLAATRAGFAQQPQPYPIKRVRILVGFAPGGIVDTLGRLLADRLTRSMGQPFVVENRPGAGANLATGLVARAKGDPYTLLLASSGPLAVSPTTEADLGYDPVADFIPITIMAKTPLVVVVPATSPHHDLQSLIQAMKKSAQEVLYPTPGVGSPQLLAQEAFRQKVGFAAAPVHYNGSAPAVMAVLAGEFPFTIENPLLTLGHIRAGKLRALAVTSKQRAPLLPDVPTMSEAGLEGFEAGGWYGLVAPAGIPAEIVNQLHAQTVAALKEPEFARRIAEMASPNITSTPEEFRAFIAAETQKWRSVLLAAKKPGG